MAQNFYCILTSIGKAKMANAYALGNKVNLTTFAVGSGQSDAYYEPTESQTALKNQVWSGNINSINVDSVNTNWIVISAIIPTTDGGFTIREAGIFDDAGDMIAVGKYPETYKPQLSEGSSKDLTINMILEVSNTSSVTLKVDPTVILATKKDIQDVNNRITTDELAVSTLTTNVLESTGYGVINGLTVTAQAIPNMTVNVASGIVHMPNGIRFALSGNNALAVNAADVTNPRIDIVYVKNDGTIGYTAGTPASTPVAPAIPTGAFLLEQINVGAGVTSITSANLTDMRKIKNTTDNVKAALDSSLADNVYQTAGGTATAITLTINGTLANGYPMTFIASANNGGVATTINNKKLYKPNTTTTPNLVAGKAYTIWYSTTGDSGNGCFFIKASAEGNVTADKVLAGYTFSNDDDTGLTGTLEDTVLTVGDTTILSSGTLKSTSSLSYTKLKEIAMNMKGTIRVSFDIQTQTSGQTSYGRVYINGVAVGIERTNATTSSVQFTEDFAISKGDKVQIYCKTSNASSLCYAQIFNIKSAFTIGTVNL